MHSSPVIPLQGHSAPASCRHLSGSTALTVCFLSPLLLGPFLPTYPGPGCLETTGLCLETRSNLWLREPSQAWKAWNTCKYPARPCQTLPDPACQTWLPGKSASSLLLCKLRNRLFGNAICFLLIINQLQLWPFFCLCQEHSQSI